VRERTKGEGPVESGGRGRAPALGFDRDWRCDGTGFGVVDAGFVYRSATELVELLAAGEVSAVELAEEAIARIERYDPTINAVCVRDFDRALAAARDADAARARGEVRPLLGVPMTVKESYHVAGLPITWGMPPFKDVISTTDALAVSRVKAAGAVVLGKTNVPFGLGDVQSYNAIYGTTRNPWDPERIPGGSSGGSAAALAAGYGALSLGSDIGGSLRKPGALLWRLRPQADVRAAAWARAHRAVDTDTARRPRPRGDRPDGAHGGRPLAAAGPARRARRAHPRHRVPARAAGPPALRPWRTTEYW